MVKFSVSYQLTNLLRYKTPILNVVYIVYMLALTLVVFNEFLVSSEVLIY